MTNTAPNKLDANAAWSLWLAGLATSDSSQTAVTTAGRLAQSSVARAVAVAGVLAAGLVAATLPPRDAAAGDAQRAIGSLTTRALPGDAPATLAETGLYSDWESQTVAADLLAFSPQYPLWSDGATKQRWIYLPSAIDASGADWVFPVGTRIWKQFSFNARTETRYMALTASGWTYATYVWNDDAAVRAPRGGVAVRVSESQTHRVPSDADCRACHANGKTPVLGFDALQLSFDRDPNAPHGELERGEHRVDLLALAIGGYVQHLDDIAPRIAGNATQRAALGYLHGNCGGCHRADGPLAAVGMELAQSRGDRVLATTAGVIARFSPQPRIVPGDAEHSLLIARMKSRRSLAQMPPIGTDVVDAEALRLVANWIDQLAPSTH